MIKVGDNDPPPLPPPPFWRTVYFERAWARADRTAISADDIRQVLAQPIKTAAQDDGRVRYWGMIARCGRWLRVVTLADGVTVHNAMFDRRFRP
jgi:hypothetical protein